ncbi:MAG: hypothetical protein KGZ53_10940 [Peptococcaceae bacterium]|nr:hypothetical protein [Peptococcaceae bacterium]
MAIGTWRMELELSQVLLMVIGAGAYFFLAVLLIRCLVIFAQTKFKALHARGGVEPDVSAVKNFEEKRRGDAAWKHATSLWVGGNAMVIAIERDLVEAAVPWHELLMVIGVGTIAFMATELTWALCSKAISRIRALRSKGSTTN